MHTSLSQKRQKAAMKSIYFVRFQLPISRKTQSTKNMKLSEVLFYAETKLPHERKESQSKMR